MPFTGLEIPILTLSLDGVNLIIKKFQVRRTYKHSSRLWQASLKMVAEVQQLVDRSTLVKFKERSDQLEVLLENIHAEMEKGYLIPGKTLRDMAATCKKSAHNLEEEAIRLSAKAFEDHLFDGQPPDSSDTNSHGNVMNGDIVNGIGSIISGNVVHNHYHVHQHVHVVPGATTPSVPNAATVRETVSNALSTELSHFPDVQETDTTPPPIDPNATTSVITELVPPPEEDTRTDTPTTVEISMELWNSDSQS